MLSMVQFLISVVYLAAAPNEVVIKINFKVILVLFIEGNLIKFAMNFRPDSAGYC